MGQVLVVNRGPVLWRKGQEDERTDDLADVDGRHRRRRRRHRRSSGIVTLTSNVSQQLDKTLAQL